MPLASGQKVSSLQVLPLFARGAGRFHWSKIFDKVGSSTVVKILMMFLPEWRNGIRARLKIVWRNP